MSDKRFSERTPIELAASYGMAEEESSETATVINISQEGFCFQTDQMLKAGSEVELSVDLEDDSNVTIPVRVAWNKKIGDTGIYMVGVQIIDASGKEFDRFLDFYNEQVKNNPRES